MPKKGSGSNTAGKVPGGTPAQKDVRNPDRIRTNLADSKRESEFRKQSLSVFNPHVEGAVAGRRDLRASDLVEEQPGFIVAVENLFLPEECQQLVAAIDAVGLNPPNAADLNPRKNEAFLCKFPSLLHGVPSVPRIGYYAHVNLRTVAWLHGLITGRQSLSFVDPHLESVVWQRLRPHFPPVDDCRAVGFDGSLRYYK